MIFICHNLKKSISDVCTIRMMYGVASRCDRIFLKIAFKDVSLEWVKEKKKEKKCGENAWNISPLPSRERKRDSFFRGSYKFEWPQKTDSFIYISFGRNIFYNSWFQYSSRQLDRLFNVYFPSNLQFKIIIFWEWFFSDKNAL